MTYSRAKLKSNGDRASPCFKPFLIGNMSKVARREKETRRDKEHKENRFSFKYKVLILRH
jgi:hypothetical protein